MKKFLTIVGIMLVAICGVFTGAGCNEDKYANAQIEVSSTALSGDTLTIGYNNSIELIAKTTGVDGINSAVNFNCSDTEALDILGITNSADGTKATIKANKPTHDNNYFVLKISSVETNTVYKELKVKVVLPIEGLDFGDAKLSVSPNNPLSLSEFLNFYPQVTYTTNQKDVVYAITNYGQNSPNAISIDSYGNLYVSDEIIENLSTDDNCLEVTVTSKSNTAIKATTKISVVKDLVDSDLMIESSQLSYNNELIPDDKLSLTLFTNADKYNRETVNVYVNSSQDIDIEAIKVGDGKIIVITEGTITKTSIDGVRYKNKITFEISARSVAGTCGVKFRVTTRNTNNSLVYEFSEDTMIEVTTSALPKIINLKQDNKEVVSNDTISIYNEYIATETTSAYGSKLVPTVTSKSSTSVSSGNKYLKLQLVDIATDNDALGEFTLTDVKGNVIDTTQGFVEVLSNNIVYLKASDTAVGRTFKLTFTTIINDFITYASGGAPSITDELITAEYYINANYGVNEITFEKDSYIIKRTQLNDFIYTENLINFTVNANADINGMYASYDTTMLTVTKLDTFSYLIVGTKLGNTEFRITAKNGCTKKVSIKIVDPIRTINLSVDNPATSQVISEATYDEVKIDDNSSIQQLKKVSAKVGGKFNVYTSTTPNITGILKTEFKSQDSNIASISNSGIITTKNSGQTKITATIQYYEFTYGEDGYARCEVKTTEVSFDITVFTPTTSIGLNRYKATIYSHDSLGFEYQELSYVEVYAVISPVTATVYGDDSAVSYKLVNNSGILTEASGTKGRYQALLPEGVNQATVMIVVTVEEFGSSVSLVCDVTVKRATQIEEIEINNLPKKQGYYILDMKEDERFDLEISLTPEKVFVQDLCFIIYDEDMVPVTTGTIVSIDGKAIVSKSVLTDSDPNSVYIRIFAKDSMTSEDSGPVYETILVTIERGTLESPYIIETADELQAIKNAPTKHYMLGADIDLNSRSWEPIANFSGSINGMYYRNANGTIISNQYKVTNLALESSSAEYIGLFADIELTGLVLNLDLSVSSVSVSNNRNLKAVGSIAGYNNGLILNSTVSLGNNFIVSASGNTNISDDVFVDIGGMVGTNNGWIYNFVPYVASNVGGTNVFSRVYTAYELKDVSIPDKYIEQVAGKDSFLYFAVTYSDGSLPATNAEQVLAMISECISDTPVHGRMQVMDSMTCPINVGGIAGRNLNTINGIFGLYNVQEELSGIDDGDGDNTFLVSNTLTATINNAGRDFSGTIAIGGNSLNKLESTVGGIVGLNKGDNTNTAKIYNVASTGKASGYRNLGGIVGKSVNGEINTVSSSTRLTGLWYVGGAVGYADNTKIHLAKVENYQETTQGGDILIQATHYVGGVVGYIDNGSLLEFSYSVSFVEESTFLQGGVSSYKADIYDGGNDIEMFVGGVAGYVGTNTELKYVYSTMSIYTSQAQSGSYTGGIAGVMTYRANIHDAYYLGKFVRVNTVSTGTIVGKIDSLGLATVEGVSGIIKNFFSNNSQKKIGSDTASVFNTSETSVVTGIVSEGQLDPFKNAVKGSANWDTSVTLNTYKNIKYPVIKYTSNVVEQDVYFIKQTPTAVTASAIDTPSKRYKKLQSSAILLTHSVDESQNTFNINDLIKFSWSPASIKSSQLRVVSSNSSVIAVKEGGRIEVKDVSNQNGIGYATLTFTSVLNLNATCTVEIVVVSNVTEVKLYNDSNLTKDILQVGTLSMKKGLTQKLFPTFYDTDSNGKLVKVNANYNIVYEYKGSNNNTNPYFSINTSSNIIEAKSETLKEGDASYKTEKDYFNIAFTSKLGFTYTFGGDLKSFSYNPFETEVNSGKKQFSIEIYTGATDIVVNPNSEIEVSGYVPQSLGISLVSDAKVDGINLVITDDNGNKIYKATENGLTILYINNMPYDLSVEEGRENAEKKLAEINFVFDIDKLQTVFVMTEGNYDAEVNITIAEGKEYFINPIGYTFEFSAVTSPEVVRSVRVLAVPQALLHLESEYRVLEGSSVSSEGKTSYVFEENPKNKLIPGKLGLISIETSPIYAGVEYFKVETTAEAMDYISIAQLYKDKSVGASGLSYIFGTNAEKIENGIILNRQSNYLKTVYTYISGAQTDKPIEDSNNYDNQITKVEQVYDFDGNLYIEILTASNIYEIEEFELYITAVFADGSEQTYTRVFETTYIPALTMEATRKYIALGTRTTESGASVKDSIEVSALVDGDYDVTMDISVINAGGGTGEGVAVLMRNGIVAKEGDAEGTKRHVGTLVLSNNAQIGNIIRVSASYEIIVEGRTEVVTADIDILVVEAVIDEVTIEKAVDNKLLFTISSSQQLQATLKGCAVQDEGVMSRLATTLSRQLTDNNTIAFWKYVYNNGEITNLDSKALSLPFSIDVKKVSSGNLGNLASVSLVGSTVSGSANLMLRAYMYYTDAGELKFAEMVDETALYPTIIEVPFVAQVMVDSTDDLPTPIYTASELLGMAEDGNYILMNDIDITTPHTPISTAIASLDGNNKIITISNFAYDTSSDSIAGSSINLGLFSTISSKSIIKNVIVALPNNKTNPMMLNNYTSINYGGLAGVNNGIITNCEVISVYDKDTYSSTASDIDMYKNIKYTTNIYTAVQVNGTQVTANIGGLVGTNGETGVITNSRVGRNYVEYVNIQEDDYNGTNPDEKDYEYTAPVTIIKLEGSGNVGGFVGINQGIISSSYFNNGQLEISSYGSNYTKTGGFVAVNSGAVYSSYSAGWEEESYLGTTATADEYYSLLSINPNTNTNYIVKSSQTNPNRKLGGGIYSNGNIGGFVYENSGYIQNTYANIRLDGDFTFAANRQNIASNVNLSEYGNLNAGGFVFINDSEAKIITSYTISKIKSNISTHGPFVGVSPSSGDVQNEGEVNKSYYLIEGGESIYSKSDPAYDISQTDDSELGEDVASIGNEFVIKETFAGFSFDNSDYTDGMTSGAVWAMKMVTSSINSSGQDSYGYPEIVSANQIAISVRVLKPNANSGEGQADYSYIYALGYEKGSSINPQIITSATEYNRVFENILGVTVKVENVNVKYTGNLRLVNNIDFSNLTPASTSFEYTSPVNNLSVFDGNNLAISNVLISDDSEQNTAFGLFKVLNDVGVKNLTLSIRGVDSTNGVAVGALAGLAVESDINNINIVAATEGAEVSGQNYVGGLAGIVVSGDEYEMHYINNINCDVSVLAGYNGGENTQIIKPGEIWSLICPPAKINSVSTDYNLRLQYLKSDVSYAGGVAGVVDLVQAHKASDEDANLESLDNINVRAINVSKLDIFYNSSDVTIFEENAISIEAAYAGGLFGFVGNETFIREASFIAYESSSTHYIMADVAAGGITAINYGYIDQTYVSFDETTQASLDNQLEYLVKGTTSITWGNQALYTGAPIYIGGIAGINIGGEVKNTGTIQNSYNRIDLINDKATRIGGIAGASHIGAFVNVYTTANVKGDFSKEVSYFGGIIGQLLNNENNRYYAISLSYEEDNAYNLEITNSTVATLWNPDYYEEYKTYTETYGIEYYAYYRPGQKYETTDPRYDASATGENDNIAEEGMYVLNQYGNRVVEKVGRIGAIFGAPTSADEVRLTTSEKQDSNNKSLVYNKYIRYEHYLVKFSSSSDNTIVEDKIYKNFASNNEEYISMYTGIQQGDINKNVYKGDNNYQGVPAAVVSGNAVGTPLYCMLEEGSLFKYLNHDETKSQKVILSKDDLIDLYTLEIGAGSNAKDKAFSKSYWSSRIWKFVDTNRLITLNFGYIPSIARIYTAEDYVKEINDSPASKKYYYIMNDIDFSGYTEDQIMIKSNFRGTITGIKQWNEDRTTSRYPILYNVTLADTRNGKTIDTMAMFVQTTNASFFNFNVVVCSYQEELLGENATPVEKRSAILIASATNTTINNVHIGTSLTSFTEGFVTFGKDGARSILRDYKRDDSNSLPTFNTYVDNNIVKSTLSQINTYASYFGGLVAEGVSTRIRDCSFNIPVNVVYFNQFIPPDQELYLGGIAGSLQGSINSSFVTSSINVSIKDATSSEFMEDRGNSSLTNAKSIYIGGVLGYGAGDISNIGYGRPSDTITSDTSKFFASWIKKSSVYSSSDHCTLTVDGKTGETKYGIVPKDRLYVGGTIGLSTILIDTTSTLVSAVASAYTYNVGIYVQLSSASGYADIGGVIGNNQINISNLQYKNKNLTETAIGNSDRYNCLSVYTAMKANVGGVVGNNDSDTKVENVYTNVSIDVEGTSTINVGGIIGQSNGIALYKAINDAGLITAYNNSTTNLGGLVGNSTGDITLNYVSSSAYIKMRDGSSGNLKVGGLLGNVDKAVILHTALSLGNIYIAKGMSITNLYSGGFVGYAKDFKRNDDTGNGLGAVVASSANYRGIGQNAEFNIGQIAGYISSLTNAKVSAFKDIYFSENLFGLYINDYDSGDSANLLMENLAEKINIIASSVYDISNNIFMEYFKKVGGSETLTYASSLRSLIEYSEANSKFVGVVGSKLNPIALTNSNISNISTKTYTYYKMDKDLSVTNIISKLNTGNFIDCRGYTIKVSSGTKAVFSEVSSEAFVVGLLVDNVSITNASPIAITNNGTLLGCGTSGKVTSTDSTICAGLVSTNNGNIINCFSIADVIISNTSAHVAGLVYKNSGNIITSYYTGTINHTVDYGSSTSYCISGLVYDNSGAYITNSYTMSNIIDASLIKSNNLYPIANDGTLNYVYYDINAYTATKNTDNSKAKTTAQLSALGTSAGPTIKGNWFKSTNANNLDDLKLLYMKGNPGELEIRIYVKSSWFNYSYSVANVNGNIPTSAGISRFLSMLYTGNGKKEDGTKTNGFLNQPFKITNAGMIESYFKTNNKSGTLSYYILQNDISFKTYTYWSQVWEDSKSVPIVFDGDFNGNGKTMYGISASKYGIFRVLGTNANVYDFTITDINSQTGLIAGAMLSGSKMNNITIVSKASSGNDYYGLCKVNNADGIKELRVASGVAGDAGDKYKGIEPAGLLLGYMEGGDITNISITGSSVSIEATTARDSGYAGGLVGYVTGGNIDIGGSNQTTECNPFASLTDGTKAKITGYNIGGIAGYSEVAVKNYTISACKFDSGTIIGGVIGKVATSSSQINLVGLKGQNNEFITFSGTSSIKAGGIVGVVNSANNTANVVFTNCSVTGNISNKVNNTNDIIGGIVASANYIKLSNCSYSGTLGSSSSTKLTAGGFVGYVDGFVDISAQTGTPVDGATIYGNVVGGLVGKMSEANGTITGFQSGANSYYITNTTKLYAQNYGYAGGVVGYIKATESKTLSNTSEKIGVQIAYIDVNLSAMNAIGSSASFGGIVGYVQGYNGAYVKINNCGLSGTMNVKNVYNIGGAVGYATSYVRINDISGAIAMTLDETRSSMETAMGGIVGRFSDASTSNYNIADITNFEVEFKANNSNSKISIGGIVGRSTSTKLQNIDIKVSGTLDKVLNSWGGIIGYSSSSTINGATTIIKSDIGNAANIDNVGGIVGNSVSENSISDNIEKAETKFNGDYTLRGKYAGGIIGKGSSTSLEDCSTLSCSATAPSIIGNYAGGIIGSGEGITFKDSTITVGAESGKTPISISTHDISDSYQYAGGLAGYISLNADADKAMKKGVEVNIKASISAYYAGGVFGSFGGGTLDYTGGKTNINVNAPITGKYIGYLIGTINTSSAVSISNIDILASVTDLDLIGLDGAYVGGFIGEANGNTSGTANITLSNLTNNNAREYGSETTPSAIYQLGGIVGIVKNGVTISNCKNTAKLAINYASRGGYVAGIAGSAEGSASVQSTISNCTNSGEIYRADPSSGLSYGGGISGYTKNAKITDCTNTGKITSEDYAGGLVAIAASGEVSITLSKNETLTEITAKQYAGGIVGYSCCTNLIIEVGTATNAGNQKVKVLASDYAGGIVGYISLNKASITGVKIVSGSIIGKTDEETTFAGGIAGSVAFGSVGGMSITSCEVKANSITGTAYAGGIVAYAFSTKLNITSCEITTKILSRVNSYNNYAGGLIGYVYSSTINSKENELLSRTTIGGSATDGNKVTTYAGGIFGTSYYCTITDDASKIDSCYIYASSAAGGIIGYSYGDSINIKNSTIINNNSIVADSGKSGFSRAGGVFGDISTATLNAISVSISKNALTSFGAIGKDRAGVVAGDFSSTTIYCSLIEIGVSNSLTSTVMGMFAFVSNVTITSVNKTNTTSYYANTNHSSFNVVVGEIVGVMQGTSSISSSSVSSKIYVSYTNNADYIYIGGILGCCESGTASLYNADFKGGIEFAGRDNDSYAYVGGIVGASWTDISLSGCDATATVFYSNYIVGGVIGMATGTKTLIYSSWLMDGGLDIYCAYDRNVYLGGIVGYFSSSSTDSYISYCWTCGGTYAKILYNSSLFTQDNGRSVSTTEKENNAGEYAKWFQDFETKDSYGFEQGSNVDYINTSNGPNLHAGGIVGYVYRCKINSCYASMSMSKVDYNVGIHVNAGRIYTWNSHATYMKVAITMYTGAVIGCMGDNSTVTCSSVRYNNGLGFPTTITKGCGGLFAAERGYIFDSESEKIAKAIYKAFSEGRLSSTGSTSGISASS